MNDQELDDILARYGKEYNAPPDNPPLEEIRERIHSARRRRGWRPWIAGGTLAAAAALIAIGVLRAPASIPLRSQASRVAIDTNTLRSNVEDPRTETANAALASAVASAQAALDENPDDPYYREHLEAMRENAERFRMIQRQLSETM